MSSLPSPSCHRFRPSGCCLIVFILSGLLLGGVLAGLLVPPHVLLTFLVNFHQVEYDGHSGRVTALAWSPDGTRIASAGVDGTVQIWESGSVQHLLTYHGHRGEVDSVAWSPDGTRIASAGREDGTVQIWDAGTGGHPLTLRAPPFSSVTTVAWSPDSQRVAFADDEDTVEIWDIRSQRRLLLLTGTSGHQAPPSGFPNTNTLAWSPDGTRIVTSSGIIWDSTTGKALIRSHDTWWAVAWSPDDRLIVSTNGDLGAIWDAASGKIVRSYPATGIPLVWSPNGKYIASADDFDTVNVRDAVTGSILATYDPSSSCSSDSILQVFDQCEQYAAWFRALAWSPDGRSLALGGTGNAAEIWIPVT